MIAAMRRTFEIRQQRGKKGKYSIVVLDFPEPGRTYAVVRGEPTIRQARALMSAYWQDVQWESETRGSFAEFEQ